MKGPAQPHSSSGQGSIDQQRQTICGIQAEPKIDKGDYAGSLSEKLFGRTKVA